MPIYNKHNIKLYKGWKSICGTITNHIYFDFDWKIPAVSGWYPIPTFSLHKGQDGWFIQFKWLNLLINFNFKGYE